MHRNLSKFATVAFIAAIGIGVPALAKSTHSGKGKAVASLSTRDVKAQRQRALDAYGSVRRSPTFGAPNPESPGVHRRRQHRLQRQPLRLLKRRNYLCEQGGGEWPRCRCKSWLSAAMRVKEKLGRPFGRPNFLVAVLARRDVHRAYDRSGFGIGTVPPYRS
jgi:hypothetical protein